MGLPRFSLKRYFFYVLCLTGTLLVLLNLLQDDIWHSTRPHPGQPQSVRAAGDGPKVYTKLLTVLLINDRKAIVIWSHGENIVVNYIRSISLFITFCFANGIQNNDILIIFLLITLIKIVTMNIYQFIFLFISKTIEHYFFKTKALL